MKYARIHILVGFFLTVSIIITVRIVMSSTMSDDLKQARESLELEKINLEKSRIAEIESERLRIQRSHLERNGNLIFYGAIGILSAVGTSLLVVASGLHRARVRQASVHIARIGQHSEIPIHQRDLQSFYPIAVNLSIAEIEAGVSGSHDKAYKMSRQMLADIADYTRALAGKRGLTAKDATALNAPDALALPTSTPTMADLLHSGEIGPGKPLITGYNRHTGQPERRVLKDLKSVAVAGAQGSGKTASEAYLIGSAVLSYGVKAYVIDPHKHHPEGLHHLIEPLEQTGHVVVINPFDTPVLLDMLNRHLENRLNGSESSEHGILLVIDELARLAKMDCFDVLITFLEKCTEETRKANMTFIGGSTKWNARHFKGRADIRGCMNSALVHRCKPSQAELLLEDTRDKKMIYDVTQAGQAVLMTDCDTTKLVQMPLCTRQDMERIAEMVGASHPAADATATFKAETVSLMAEIDTAVTADVQSVTVTSQSQLAATSDNTMGPEFEQQRKDLKLSLRDVARKIGLTEKKKIATFATRLQRFEKNNGKLEPDEIEAVTAVLFSQEPEILPKTEEALIAVTPPYIQ